MFVFLELCELGNSTPPPPHTLSYGFVVSMLNLRVWGFLELTNTCINGCWWYPSRLKSMEIALSCGSIVKILVWFPILSRRPGVDSWWA